MSTLQQQRRTNPYPFTWEVPAVVAVGVGYALVMAVHLGRGAAHFAACGRWPLTPSGQLFTALPGILAGDAAAGLADPGCSPAASGLAGWVAAAVLLTALALVVVGKLAFDRWGPGRLKGLASRSAAEAILGRGRLRSVRHVIRPDLYPRKRAHR